MPRKALAMLPFALIIYAPTVVVTFLASFFPGLYIPLALRNEEVVNTIYTYADTLSLYECEGGIKVSDLANQYLVQGKGDPKEIISFSYRGATLSGNFTQCVTTFFEPYIGHRPAGNSQPMMNGFSVSVVSPHCPGGRSCLSVGEMEQHSISFVKIPFHTPFNNVGELRVQIV